jgi:tRNA-dihydrouridine synthase
MTFWQRLPKPFFVLAPMDDVTDTVFRQIVASVSPPDVYFTEFASVDGLQSAGRERVLQKLRFTRSEQPLIAQIWGLKPDNYFKTAEELAELGFAGIDINMGCPVPKIIKLGACSALINNRSLAADIIAATRQGAAGLPVSVKTRVGFGEADQSWTQFLLEQSLDALIVHGRTAKQQSKVPNNWELVGQVRAQRDELAPETVFIGNGDVNSKARGRKLAKQFQLDGVMIGRGVLKDPYVFAETSPWVKFSKAQRIDLFRRHIELFAKTWGERKNPASLKKFAKLYIQGFGGAKELREQLMSSDSPGQLLAALAKTE